MSADRPAPADLARRLLRAADRAALAVGLAGGDRAPWPYAALVLMAVDHDLAPLLLISTLAEHTRAIAADPRVSLLVDGTREHEQPLTGPRLTVLGRADKTDSPRVRRRYLARHPDAAVYAGFADFAFYRIEVERAHLVGGFGMIHWIDGGDIFLSQALGEPLPEAEADIVQHMNADHADAVELYAGRLLGRAGSGWRMTGIDRDGIDLRLAGATARLDFEAPVRNAAEARQALVSLVERARRSA